MLLVGLIPFFLFLDELTGDITFVLKIFVLMSIYSYVMNHIGKGPLGMFIFGLIAWLVIFDYFAIFGTIYILYTLLAFGLTSIIIDFMFITPGAKPAGADGMGDPISNGKDFAERQADLHRRHGMLQGLMGGRR